MEMNLTTPAVLFPAVSLLLLAYTNRFIALANAIRSLHGHYKTSSESHYLNQIDNMRKRIRLIRNMQFAGVVSLLLCTICMVLLFFGFVMLGEFVFSTGLIAMIFSLILSLVEIQMSIRALDIHLQDIEQTEPGEEAP